MAFPIRRSTLSASGDFDSDAAGTVKSGGSVTMADVSLGTLSALFTLDAETDTLTLTAKWQVSEDGSTWYDVHPENGAALVAQATGTAGADAAVSRVLPAPSGVQGWKFARAAVANGVATGASADTYSITTRWARRQAFSGK